MAYVVKINHQYILLYNLMVTNPSIFHGTIKITYLDRTIIFTNCMHYITLWYHIHTGNNCCVYTHIHVLLHYARTGYRFIWPFYFLKPVIVASNIKFYLTICYLDYFFFINVSLQGKFKFMCRAKPSLKSMRWGRTRLSESWMRGWRKTWVCMRGFMQHYSRMAGPSLMMSNWEKQIVMPKGL